MIFFTRLWRFIVLCAHLMQTTFQMLRGAWRISKLSRPLITIFGSSRIEQGTPYAYKAGLLGKRFIENNISVLTGGGPGIMEAASCKVKAHGKAKAIGIGARGLDDRPQQCMSEYFEVKYFFARKWLLTEFSSAFVIFPGGFGTLDEMTGVLTLFQVKTLKKVPLVLIGKEFWQPFVDWINNEALVHGTITKEELEFFYLTDDLDEAYCWLIGKCDILKNS